MCIAILQKSGATITRRQLRNCWENNSDGAGLAWIEKGELLTFKELDSFKRFYKSYRAVVNRLGRETKMLVHFRWATHGWVDEDNCHPFMVHDKLAFIHNGIISINTPANKSDTVMFNERFLKNLPRNMIHRARVIDHIDRRAQSILVFLDAGNDHLIIGEDKGHWENNVWYSNYDHAYIGADFAGTGYTQYTGLGYSAYGAGKYVGSRGQVIPFNDKDRVRDIDSPPNTPKWDSDGEETEWEFVKCDDKWVRYEKAHYGKGGKENSASGKVDYSSDSMTAIHDTTTGDSVNALLSRVDTDLSAQRRGKRALRKAIDDKVEAEKKEECEVTGKCHRCGCHSSELKMLWYKWYCSSCIMEITNCDNGYKALEGEVSGICCECGEYDQDLSRFADEFYCPRCFKMFNV